MAATSYLYGKAVTNGLNGHINWSGDTIKMALFGNGYSPNLSTDNTYSGISGNEISGTGYVAGGAALGSPSITETAANSWGTSWAGTNAQTYGDVIIPGTPNGFLYMCVAAGTTGGSTPTFPTTIGQTVADSGVTWANMGQVITVFSSNSVSWASSTITAYYGVIYDATTGYLINLQTFTGAETDTNGTFVVAPFSSTYGWFFIFS